MKSIEGINKEGTHPAFRPIALNGSSHFFPSNKGDTGLRISLKKEDKPGGMPDFIRPFIEPVELSLAVD
jgi:hypothetical protein